jgi:hypothetical protein
MTPEQLAELMAQIQSVATELRSHVDKSCADVTAKFDAAMGEIARKKADNGDDDYQEPGMARKTAADAVARGELQVLRDQVNTLVRERPAKRTQGQADAYADAQSSFDVAYVSNGQRADAPMQGEDIVAYNIRLARGLQKFSPKWKNADLAHIARDDSTFRIALEGIKSDAVAHGLNPPDLKPFDHRMITKQMDTGHIQRSFVGVGTIFKQLARPARYVTGIGHVAGLPRISGGSAVYDA